MEHIIYMILWSAAVLVVGGAVGAAVGRAAFWKGALSALAGVATIGVLISNGLGGPVWLVWSAGVLAAAAAGAALGMGLKQIALTLGFAALALAALAVVYRVFDV